MHQEITGCVVKGLLQIREQYQGDTDVRLTDPSK